MTKFSNIFENITVIFTIAIISYTLLVLLIFFILRKAKPELFSPAEKAQPLSVNPREITFLDCSALYTVFPCGCCSFRQVLKKCCPARTISLREFATCECIRPAVQGTIPYRVHLVCCTI